MYGKEYEVYCKRYQYAYYKNTMIALICTDGSPYCTLTTNPDFHIKDNKFYSCPNNYGPILEKMIDLKMIKLGDSVWRSGFNTYQSFIINENIFSQYERELP